MRSKTLSNKDRERILSKVQAAAEAQWEASPLQAEMNEIEAKIQALVDEDQLRLVPQAHRDVLDLYGAKTARMAGHFQLDSHGEAIYTPWPRERKFATKIRVNMYVGLGVYPAGYIDDCDREFADFLTGKAPGLLPRYIELGQRRRCETDEIVAAHKAILDTCTTTKQAYDNELLRPYLPADLLAWEPKAPGDAARAISETALARAKAFQASIAKEE